MKSPIIILVVLLLVSVGTVHASITLNMNEIPLQGQACTFLSPQQLQTAYGFGQLYSSGINGNGQSVAIIVAYGDSNLQADVNAFDSQYSLPSLSVGSNLMVVTPFGKPQSSFTNWTAETALDVETVHSLAPGARIYVVEAPNENSLFSAINYTVNNLPVTVISVSWGSSESSYTSSDISYLNSVLYNAEQKGVNIFVASGDTGAYNSQSFPNVNFPASSPYVVSVGGSTLSVSSSGSYQGETAWNGSGGGNSEYFYRPPFQPDLNSYRMVPDVAFNAGTPVCIESNLSIRGYYGTSLSAPSWAAIDSLINQKVKGDKAFLLQELYKTYSDYGSLAFNSITSGCNGLYCASNSYNEVTGLGSPKVYQLVQIISKAQYKITFDPSTTDSVFSVNGINYSSTVSLNFTYGQKVSIIAYSGKVPDVGVVNFSSFSGIVNAADSAVVFFVNTSGILSIHFNEYFIVSLNGVMGNSTSASLMKNGSSLDLTSPLYVNYSGVQYTLVGFTMNGGPVVYSGAYSIDVYAPMNVSFVWHKIAKTPIATEPIPSLLVTVSFYSFAPLSNKITHELATLSGSSGVFAVNGTEISVYSKPQVVSGYRYELANFTTASGQQIIVNFTKEKSINVSFYSEQDVSIVPSSLQVGFDGVNETYINSTTIWGPLSGGVTIESVLYKGVEMLDQPVRLYSNSSGANLTLPISDVTVRLVTYFGIPVVGAGIYLSFDNISIYNSTSISGSTTFYNIPQKPYSLRINAYGTKYTFSNLDTASLDLTVSPILYQLYIILGLVLVVLLSLFLFERLKHRSNKSHSIK